MPSTSIIPFHECSNLITLGLLQYCWLIIHNLGIFFCRWRQQKIFKPEVSISSPGPYLLLVNMFSLPDFQSFPSQRWLGHIQKRIQCTCSKISDLRESGFLLLAERNVRMCCDVIIIVESGDGFLRLLRHPKSSYTEPTNTHSVVD